MRLFPTKDRAVGSLACFLFQETLPLADLRSRIAGELIWAPSVVLPIVAGASSWFLSWAVSGSVALNIAGLAGVLVGVGWLATRVIFLSDDVAAKVLRDEAARIKQAEEEKLDDLLVRLRSDRDYRTKDFLTLLRTCRNDFEEFAKQPGIAIQSQEIVKQVRQLFWASTQQLEQSLQMHGLAERLSGDQRKRMLGQREQVLQDIQESIDHMQSAVKHYQELMNKETRADLSTLRDELDASIRIAKKTEERIREIEGEIDLDDRIKQ